MQNFLTFLHNPLFAGLLVVAAIILGFALLIKTSSFREKKMKGQKRTIIIVDYLVETAYNFFSEILGEKAPFRIKSYITNLFLVILIANLFGLMLDILISPFPFLGQYIQSPTGDISFTLALAVCSMLIVLIVEAQTKGIFSFFYNYFPLRGTDLFHLSKPSSFLSLLLRLPAKLFDIIISLFIGILNIIGTFAKVISLAFRLYGNMMAGSLLLAIIIGMLGQVTKSWLAGWEFPFLVPLIFYAQSALTAVVQAFVFSLLTSVFIKMSLEEESGKTQAKSSVNHPKPVHQQLVQSIQRETA